MTDHTSVGYVKNESEQLWLIGLGAIYDENDIVMNIVKNPTGVGHDKNETKQL